MVIAALEVTATFTVRNVNVLKVSTVLTAVVLPVVAVGINVPYQHLLMNAFKYSK